MNVLLAWLRLFVFILKGIKQFRSKILILDVIFGEKSINYPNFKILNRTFLIFQKKPTFLPAMFCCGGGLCMHALKFFIIPAIIFLWQFFFKPMMEKTGEESITNKVCFFCLIILIHRRFKNCLLFGIKERKMLCSALLQSNFDYACNSW